MLVFYNQQEILHTISNTFYEKKKAKLYATQAHTQRENIFCVYLFSVVLFLYIKRPFKYPRTTLYAGCDVTLAIK